MKKYILCDTPSYTNFHDTSFGNRILFWEFAQTINKLNNYEYTILVKSEGHEKWGEMHWLEYPNTFSVTEFKFPKTCRCCKGTNSVGECMNYIQIEDYSKIENFVFENSNRNANWVHVMFSHKTFNWLSGVDNGRKLSSGEFTNIVLETYKETNHRPIFDIEIYDKKLETIIKKEVENRVGLHLRSDSSNSVYIPTEVSRKEFVKEKLDRYVRGGLDKFYLSTDIFTHPTKRLIDHQFSKFNNGVLGDFDSFFWTTDLINKDDEFWKDSFYEYDKEEYVWTGGLSGNPDILLEMALKGEEFQKEKNWIKELYDEYDIVDYGSVLKKYDTYIHNFYKLRCIEVIDLFSLIYSVEFTDKLGNSNGTFSQFVKNYREKFIKEPFAL